MGKRLRLTLAALLMLVCTGCSAVDEFSDFVNLKYEQLMVGEAVIVDSISTDCFAYQQLEEEERIVYDQILEAMLSHKDVVLVSTKSAYTLQKAYDYVMADYGGIFWVSGFQYNTYENIGRVLGIEFMPKYTYSKGEREAYQANIDETVSAWLSDIDPNASDYDKAKFVFDLMFEHVDYELDSKDNQNIISVFCYGKSVCQGYANATKYLLDELGVEAAIVRGTASGEAHAWNLVMVDGEYYLMDTTWGNSRYIMGDNSIEKRIDYRYFCGTSEFFSQTHWANTTFELPECTADINRYR